MVAEYRVGDVHTGLDRLLRPDSAPAGVTADEEQAADRRLDGRFVRTALPDDLPEADGFAAVARERGLTREVGNVLRRVEILLFDGSSPTRGTP